MLEQIKVLVEPLLSSLGLELWGIEYLPGSRGVLRIFIERNVELAVVPAPDESADESCEDAGESVPLAAEAGASIDECTEASRLIGLTLDVEDIISGAYVLEVSTPGLDRIFFKPAQLAAYAGSPLELHLHEPAAAFPGRKRFTGLLTGAEVTDEKWCFTLKIATADELALPELPEDVQVLEFDWPAVKKARLLYIVPEKPGTPAKKKAQKKKN